MKVLLLSCNTGQGHNAAAKAVLEELERRGVPCRMCDALSFAGERTSKVVSGTYMRMAAEAPRVFGKMYQAGAAISNPHVKSPVYFANMAYAGRLGRYVQENGFDAVVMPHLFPAQALTHFKKHEGLNAKTYFVGTDYTCHPFTEEIDADLFFVAHEDVVEEFARRGIPREKICASGIPTSSRFSVRTDKTEARQRLGIPVDTKMFLVMTGSMGAGSINNTIETILKGGSEQTRIYVMTGKNEDLKHRVDEMNARDGRIVAVPFTTEVPLYMSAADVLLTKPGGLTTTEAAVAQIPMILSAPIPGCETINAEFFEERGMAVCVQDEESAAHAALWLAADGEKRESMQKAQAEHINARAASDICDIILGVKSGAVI